MKIEKKLLMVIGIILSMSLINLKEVKAESIEGYTIQNSTRQMTISPYARFYSLNGRNATAKTTSSNVNNGSFGTQDTVTVSGSGELICFNTNELLANGVTYSLSVFLGGTISNNYFKENVNDPKLSFSYSLGQAQANWTNQDYKINTITHTATSGTIELYENDIDGDLIESGLYTNILEYIITPTIDGNSICVPFNAVTGNYSPYIYYFGYRLESLGKLDALTSSQMQSIINNSGLATASSVQQVNTAITNMQTSINNSISQQTQTQHQDSVAEQNAINGITNADYNGTTEQPNMTDYNTYETNENTLLNVANGMSLSNISVGIDTTTSSKIWEIITRIFQSNTIIWGMLLSLLSVGIIKLMLNR